MRIDQRLSRMLHVLLHMARVKEPLTSDRIAAMLHTNPVVVRRTLGGLREAGFVRSEKGHGGGWTLARPLAEISLLDVHQALGGDRVFRFGLDAESPDCVVASAVNRALEDVIAEANALLFARMAATRLSDLVPDFDARCESMGFSAAE